MVYDEEGGYEEEETTTLASCGKTWKVRCLSRRFSLNLTRSMYSFSHLQQRTLVYNFFRFHRD
jgi:hypothetical protein